MSNSTSVAQMYQQSGLVLSGISGLADKFPELKSNQQYQQLIDSIQQCESQLEASRATYNKAVKEYNTVRSSIPTVFFAPVMGFKPASYLEFHGNEQANGDGRA
jgi:LemA protein